MKRFSNGLLPVIVILSFTILGCTKTSVNPFLGAGQNPGQNQTTFAVTLSSSPSLGDYLVDKDGFTLYSFADDFKGNSTCQGACAALWPYFYAGVITQANIGNGLNIADFGTTTEGGVTQTTYKGWPLYYYAPSDAGAYGNSVNVREAPGLIGGDGYNGIWFVAKPDYTVFLADGQLYGEDGINYLSNYVPGAGNTIYITNPNGRTLYNFTLDVMNTNNFTLTDFSNNVVWPIYEPTPTTTSIVVPSALDKSLFSTISVLGHNQLTYKGWPLYFYFGDGNFMGSNKGVSVTSPGYWKVLTGDSPSAP